MSNFIDINTVPFTREQLRYFRREIERKGSFEELMIEKQALKKEKGTIFIAIYKDIQEYKEKYLTRIYEPLHEHYNTQVPYVFWSNFFDILCKVSPAFRKNLEGAKAEQ